MKLFSPHQYQPRAEQVFNETRAQLAAKLPLARIEHVGSSAIYGALSKGDVDICVCVPREDFSAAFDVITQLGYAEKADTLRTPQLCMFVSLREDVDLAVQLIEAGSEFEFFFTFRDALRADPVLVERYNWIKLKSAGREEKLYREAKVAFIQEVLQGIKPAAP